jgi:RTX calcium-binding nonapeptide repeat (4 copies)
MCSNGRMRTARRAACALWLAALLVCPAVASAATVSAVQGAERFTSYTDVLVLADPGERNQLTVQQLPGGTGTRVTDSLPLRAGFRCELQADGSVICPGAGARITVDAGDLDDRVEVGPIGYHRRLTGGDGDDQLIATGETASLFTGGPGDDRMTGGTGADVFFEGPAANGSDVMEGDARDTVSYRQRTINIHADLAGDADDGEAPEQDRIGTGIGRLLGGFSHDRLAGGPGPDLLMGFGGSDALLGGGGDDQLIAGLQRTREPTNDRLYGGRGRDDLHGGGGNDLIVGGQGADSLFGRYGRDALQGGPGRDIFSGGPGNDRSFARDRLSEPVDCGGGFDRVRHDAVDLLTRDCERHGPSRRLEPDLQPGLPHPLLGLADAVVAVVEDRGA